MRPFVHLHTHSDYSLLDGAQRVPVLVDRAKQLGMPALALTDHGNLFGAMHFYKACKKAGVQPILGMEAYVAMGSRLEKPKRLSDYYHLVLLARNTAGYHNLLRLASEGYLSGFHYKPRIDQELLRTHSDGILALSACLKGQVAQTLLAGDFDAAVRHVRESQEIFGKDHYFLEMQKHGIDLEDQVNELLPRLARETGAPIVITNDSHYLCEDHSTAHDILLCIQTGKDLDDPKRFKFSTHEVYFKDGEAMAGLVPDHLDYIENSLLVADRCKLDLPLGRFLLPHFPIPPGYATPDAFLTEEAAKGLHDRYPGVTGELRERLHYELGVIERMGFAGYFLIVADFVRAARERGIAVGPGRGSAAGSLVCYCLGITDVDPIAHDLLFERFLNPERISMPDIDIDFDERRGEVIEYVKQKYGSANVCQIITFGTMAARGVVRDVGRVLKLSYADTDKIAKKIPAVVGMTLEKAQESVPELKEMESPDHPQHELMKICKNLEGIVRHASIHAAGIVITPSELVNHVPLYKSVKDEVTTQWDMTVLESVGLLKMDFLGLRTLTVLAGAVRLIRDARGIDIDWRKIPLDDPQTYELLRAADTVGVFQLESSGMRDLLRKIAPDRFEDIAAINALFRPGPLKSGMVTDFIERKHGRKKIETLHPILAPILQDTYGVILYQEQVMRIASELSGFSLGEADLLRKAMGKKNKEVMDAQMAKFVDGAVVRGVKREIAVPIWEQIVHFAGYGFNKSHSVAYAMISVQTAYLKANFPAEYMAATLSTEMEDTSRIIVLIEDCRRRGVDVLPPDVNTSVADFRVDGGCITFGLNAIKNVGAGTVEAVVRERDAGGPFEDLFDFCDRVETKAWNRRVLESLVQGGAMDRLPGHRAQQLASIDTAIDNAQRVQQERARGQSSLFGDAAALGAAGLRPTMSMEPEWSESERLTREKAALGFYLSGHPLAEHKELLRDVSTRTTLELQESEDSEQAVLAGAVASRKVIFDKKGKPMAFVKLEDFVGASELLLFADAYQKYEALLVEDAVVVVSGRASAREEQETKLLCDTVLTLEQAVATLGRTLHLELDAESVSPGDVTRLQSLLAQNPGPCEVFLRLRNSTRDVRLRSRNTRIAPTRALVDALRALLGAGAVKLTCAVPPPARPAASMGFQRGGAPGPRRDTGSRGVDRAPAVP